MRPWTRRAVDMRGWIRECWRIWRRMVACTDPRCTPEEYLGMSSASGDKATIVRTAGARAQPALSTLYVLSAVGNLGKKGVIMVIGHTDCGLQGADDEEIRRLLVGAVDEGQEEKARGTLREARFGAFVRPDISVMEDVDMLTASPFFRGMEIVGFVQDTETGLVTEVSEWRVQENRKSDVQSREIEQAKANGGK
ncbi:hypothetical protein BJ875DRAFT_69050 [Amylocarpus encephaloides]|uniref:Carbonic anhydrase n=1 Tax=Amylocarpus encephaloides TaxID=45428 RepID=A0A9P7YFK5_9HELO|nr:hypothetical protein BJ875DRAFT_69050 [Amylocarpus encephaloides]